MAEIDLIQHLKDFRPTEAYILTFSIDLHYYESFLLPLIQQLGCRKNVVIADGNKIHDDLESDPSYLNKIGREYLLIPIHSDFAFHPKIYLFKKKAKDSTFLLCFMGSGNLTYPGLNTNQELFVTQVWDKTGRAPKFWHDVSAYFSLILNVCPGVAPKLAQKWLSSGYPQEFEKEGNTNTLSLIRYPDEKGIVDQFRSRLKGKNVKHLFITAPFYDADLSSLRRLITGCKPKKIELLIQPGKTSVTTKRLITFLHAAKNVTLKAFEPKDHQGRYLHAKIIAAITDDGEHALVGSANISDVALFGTPGAFNYEACVYERVDSKMSILRVLDVKGISKPLRLDDIPEKVVEFPFQGQKGALFKLISAECNGGVCFFTVLSAEKHDVLGVEIGFSDGRIETVSVKRKLDLKGTFICEEKAVRGAISARLLGRKGLHTNLVPILFVAEIERKSRHYFTKAEKLRRSFLCATNEFSKDNYLDLIVDSLIQESLKALETKGKAPRISSKHEESINGRATIKFVTERPLAQGKAASITEMSFTEGLDYVISVLREERRLGAMEEDVRNTEEDRDYEEYDQKVQEGKEETPDEVDVLHAVSNRLKSRRRAFVKNESIQDPLIRASYFSLIALPHIPKLHRSYIGDDKETHLCVEDEEWEEFLISSCNTMGSILFKAPSKEIWPNLAIDVLKKSVFELCVSSFLYALSTIYRFLKHRSESLGEEGFNNVLLVNQFVNLLATLIRSYLKIEGTNIDGLRNKLTELQEHFPCGWLHVEESLWELFNKAVEFEKNNFKNPTTWEFGEVFWMPGRGFILHAKGRHEPLWC